MKPRFFLITKPQVACRAIVIMMLMLTASTVCASTAEPFLSEKDYADFATMFTPPGIEDPLFFNDLCVHARAHALTDSCRAEVARQDSPWDIGVAKRFEEAFGQPITLEYTPELYLLLERTSLDVSLALRPIKQEFHRDRPYVFFGEKTLIPDDEEDLRSNGSFPSGHSAVGFAFALILAELAPEHQTELLQRGIDFGNSRVIANYHWQSDVETGRVIAAMVVSRLHACDAFREQLERARHEHRVAATTQMCPPVGASLSGGLQKRRAYE